MGTNFYTVKGKHIGKRSAAGMYCWDCGKTLCIEGEAFVHYTYKYGIYLEEEEVKWFDECPKCGKKKPPRNRWNDAIGRELGFNKEPFAPKTGIKSCSSFTWAMNERKALKYKYVKDEYGCRFTITEFKEILSECPIQFYNLLGREFS